ncbi:MAG TPA: hypothetical protein DGG95_03595 [Cytophagales bacterium]|jgi:hypothetical protein|nr:hypothetical protein [Cytophagales bacterium]
MRNFLVFMLVHVSVTIYSQKPPIKFGDIPMEDMTMKVYKLDSSASAIVLADYGESKITYAQGTGFSLTFERLTRIKILRKEGLSWADFEIPMYEKNGKAEKYSGLKGATFNLENGKIIETKLKTEEVHQEQTTENWKQVKFAMPSVREGSVVEVAYKITSPFWSHLRNWEFQSRIPTRVSEYRAKIPEYFNYQKYMQGYVALSVNESEYVSKSILLTEINRPDDRGFGGGIDHEQVNYQENDLRWVANNVPAFKTEPDMNSITDYISRINFELAFVKWPNRPVEQIMGTWVDINNSFLKDEEFGQAVAGSNFLKSKVEELITGITDPAQKITAIYKYVKENVIWDESFRRYIDNSFKKVLEDKKGSSAEINLLLTSMLQKAGLAADPVLISTRNHGMVRERFPLSNQFNYVICLVRFNDKSMLLDATDRSMPMNILPERCLNGKGFIISEANSGWVDLTPNVKSKTTVSYDLSFVDDANMKGKITLVNSGYNAQKVRAKYFSKGESDYIKTVAETNHWEVQKSQYENIDKLSEPTKEIYEMEAEGYAQTAGQIAYINPILLDRFESNPYKSEKREFPVDFKSPFEKMIIGKITIPEEYQVDELPKPKVLALPNNEGRYTYNINLMGNTISFTSILTINKSLFTQDEYSGLREFYNQIVAKQAEQIVLKKK